MLSCGLSVHNSYVYTPGGSPTINVLGFTLVVGSLKNNINPYTWVAIWIVKDIIIFYDKCGSLLHEILKIR